MAVQAFFNSGVLTVHSGNATPDVPEYADDAVGDPGAPMEARTISSKSRSPSTPSMPASAASTSAVKTPQSPMPEWGPWEVASSGHGSSAASTGYVNPSSFQIVSAGGDAGSRLFVGNLAMHSEAVSEPVQKGAWIADVTYESAACLHSAKTPGW